MFTSKMISVVLTFVLVIRGQEPMCSKFHYESQTLEKMIRQELAVEKMKAEMEETRKQVSSALSELRAERETFKREVDSIKTQEENEKQRMAKELGDIKGVMLTPVVAFQAMTLKNNRPDAGETFVFTTTVINKGNGYDNQTGMFTAPHKGLYSFNFHLCLQDTNCDVYYQITSCVKTFLKGRFVNQGGNRYACFSVQALGAVEQDEKVFVKMVSTSIGGKDVIWENEEVITNQFAGVLLQTEK